MSHLDDDAPREECGVFGIAAPPGRDVSRLTYYALHALQHRGQESAGIATARVGFSATSYVAKKTLPTAPPSARAASVGCVAPGSLTDPACSRPAIA